MLKATQDLFNYFKESRQEYRVVEAYCRTIALLGTPKDFQAVEDFFLENFQNSYAHSLVHLLSYSKNAQDTAKKVLDICFEKGVLKEDAPEELLNLLGYLQYEPALPILEYYTFNENNYYINQSAVLGLLHFPCTHLQSQIRQAIEECYGKNLFKEFIPALVSKLDDKTEILQNLYTLGSTICSTDCNGGIVLGFALSGKEGETYFKKVYADPYWELDASATGSVYWTYAGFQHLGIPLKKLYQELKNTQDPKIEKHLTRLLLSFLRIKINNNLKSEVLPIQNNVSESFLSIYKRLYGWENPNKSNNIIDLAKKNDIDKKSYEADLQKQAYELERLLEQKVQEEILLENFKSENIHLDRK
ncbi:MAG: hypothetical protein MUC49_07775 [Raineya sp.]|jgi:hypothetical protein|nr:hypothetical protein [Raineya sp.]